MHPFTFHHLEGTRLVENFAEVLDGENLLPRLKVWGRYPMARECDFVAEAAGHAPGGEDADGLQDREEERLGRCSGPGRVSKDLDLGQVQVTEELLRDEVRERVVMKEIVPHRLVRFRTYPTPVGLESSQERRNN
jgi:hypothetical protein